MGLFGMGLASYPGRTATTSIMGSRVDIMKNCLLTTGLVLVVASLFLTAPLALESPTREPNALPLGKETQIDGVIVERSEAKLLVRQDVGAEREVLLRDQTVIRERKKNLLRGAIGYSREELIPGLNVRIKGWGDLSGNLVAKEIRFTQDDLKIAKTIWSRVSPVEAGLENTQTEVGLVKDEVGRNAQRTQGQIEELEAAFRMNRDGVEEAKAAADSAAHTAEVTKLDLDATKQRLSDLDSFKEVSALTVLFKFNSVELTPRAKTLLDGLVDIATSQTGYLMEIRGFASSDGNPIYNRQLSEKRALQVLRYLVDHHNIPLRRIVSPYGHGDAHPIANDTQLAGRKLNRRVVIRLLVNKGMGESGIPG